MRTQATFSHYIAVSTPGLQRNALAEMRVLAPDMQKQLDYERGTFLAQTSRPASTFLPGLAQADPIYVKHIMPVDAQLPLTQRRADDFPALLAALQALDGIHPADYFTVQCRRVGHGFDYAAKDVEVFIGGAFEAQGAVPVFCDTDLRPVPGKDPALDGIPESELILEDWHKVISLYLNGTVGYAGVCTIGESLNEHCDENRIFARRSRMICRAEFKLLEALRKFGLVPGPGRALDLGAAPGGWTQGLAEHGMQVTALDPAELALRVAGLPNVRHVRQRAEDYVADGMFDLLVNDMYLLPDQSAAMMVRVAAHLKPGAPAIMTVKQVGHHPDLTLERVLPILSTAYEVLRAKCLFHNRLEVTLLLRRKDRLPG
jgi:23S rRNA (cytidine2498-2'-O)-methyltransferase